MNIPIYHIDSFSKRVFGGNPAAVCILEHPLPDETMQSIAAENNLSETAFLIKNNDMWRIRWFSPKMEIDLCGHAMLASAYVLFREWEKNAKELMFQSNTDILKVKQGEDHLLVMDFPSMPAKPCHKPPLLDEALGIVANATYQARDLLIILDSEKDVRRLKPNFYKLEQIEGFLGFIVTAKGINVDFVSRFFAPKVGINEDPVTGSAHCTLIPYWAEKLKKSTFHAKQLSARGGDIFCEFKNERVLIKGHTAIYSKGFLYL